MPLSLVKTGTSAGYGALDIVIDYFDPSAHGTFQGATDWSRAIAVAGGAALAHYGHGRMSDVGEALELAAIPLLEKSVVDFVLTHTGNVAKIGPSFGASRGQILIRRPSALGGGQVGGVVY